MIGAFPLNAESRRKKKINNIYYGKNSDFLTMQKVAYQGYLYKKSSGVRKDWKKRWFVLHDGRLYYYREKKNIPATKSGMRKKIVSFKL